MSFTLDQPAPGVVLAQPRRGFRYGAEAFWLFGFVAEEADPGCSVLDLGCGSGVIAALFAWRGHRAMGVDVRPEWQEAWALSRARSTVSLDLRHADVRAWAPAERYDRVVSNPPFYALNAGPVPAEPWRAAARAETEGSLADFVAAGAASLAVGGRLALVVPVERRDELVALAAVRGLRPVRSVQVGRRRWLAEFAEVGAGRPSENLAEEDARVRGWYPER